MSPEYQEASLAATLQLPAVRSGSPLYVGDAIHILNRKVYDAVVTRDEEVLAGLCRKQEVAGAQALAVNLGPGKSMGEKTRWVVDTMIRYTDLPLFFSANIVDQDQVLKKHGHRIAINAVTADRDELERALAAAGEYGSSLVVLLVRAGRVIAGSDDRILLASEVLEMAQQQDFPPSRLYLDPVLTCRLDPAAWHVSRGMPDVGTAVESINLIKQLDSSIKTILGLGNGTEGMEKEKRIRIQGRMLSLLVDAGLDAVLLNCLDGKVMRLAEEMQGSRELNHGGAGIRA